MRRTLLWILVIVTAAGVLLLTGTVIAIRSGLQRISDEAMSRFPGGRAEALMRVVDCTSCPIVDRNHAVWALGQIVDERSLPVLTRHFDGEPCSHEARLCQYELRKAIRNIEAAKHRTGPAWRLIARLHQSWR